MEKEKLIEQINEIISRTEDTDVLYDMLVLIKTIYKHYKDGNWGC